MAASSTFLSFSSSRDLFNKCLFEFNSLPNVSKDPERSYLIFNLITSLNHLLDWVENDESLDDGLKESIIKAFWPYDKSDEVGRAFQGYKEKGFQCNQNQRLIRLLSNKSKHVKVSVKKEVATPKLTSFPELYGSMLYGEFLYSNSIEVSYFVNTVKGISIIILLERQIDAWQEIFSSIPEKAPTVRP